MFHVYVLQNQTAGKLYIGQTSNLLERVRSHNQKIGNHYTARFAGEWQLVYSEQFGSRTEAIAREKQLKSSGGRSYLKQLIPGS